MPLRWIGAAGSPHPPRIPRTARCNFNARPALAPQAGCHSVSDAAAMSHRNAISLAIAAIAGVAAFVLASSDATAHRREGHRREGPWRLVVVAHDGRYFPGNYWDYGNGCAGTLPAWNGMARYGLIPALNGGYWVAYGGWIPPAGPGCATAYGY
jgi:hypothetical protein